jgi:hypothetical protein
MPACPQCTADLQGLRLPAHDLRQVELDVCAACRLVWFDAGEAMRLSAPGWIALLQRLAGQGVANRPWSGSPLACPRCAHPLRLRHDLSRYGRFVAQDCPAGHGSALGWAALLARRGLVRAPTPAEGAAMRAEPQAWACLNCGAPWTDGAVACGHCGKPALLVDLPRLADSLRPRAAGRPTVSGGRPATWACHACGQVLDPTRQIACGSCGHPVMAPVLADLRPLLGSLAADWHGPPRAA